MARRGSCLFWAAVCGLVLGCVLGVVDDGTTQVDVPSMDSNTATSTLESLPVDVTASVPLRDHDESGCASSLGVPPTAAQHMPANTMPSTPPCTTFPTSSSSSSSSSSTTTLPTSSGSSSSSTSSSSFSSSCLAWLRTSSTTTFSIGGWDDGQPNPEPIPDDTATVWNTGWNNNHGVPSGDANVAHSPPRGRDGWHYAGATQPSGGSNPPGWDSQNDGWYATGHGSSQAPWSSTHGGWSSWSGSSSSSGWHDPGWGGHPHWNTAASTSSGGPRWQWDDGNHGGWGGQSWDAGRSDGWNRQDWRDAAVDEQDRQWSAGNSVPGRRANQWRAGTEATRGRGEQWSQARGQSTEPQRSTASSSSQAPRNLPGRGTSSSTSGTGGWARPRREQPVGFWKGGEWVGRERTSSEERAQRGGQGPVRQARRGRLRQQWLDGTFRPAAFSRGVDRTSDAAIRARAHFAAILGGAAQHATGGWSRQQWEDWEGWAINSVLVVDWAQDGLLSDEDVHYMDEDDEAGFLQMGGYAGLDVDTFSLMELTEDEEALLAELHLPDAVRRNLRETLRTLQRHDAEDQGPEYRWSTAEWVASWDQACADVSRVVRCLRRRLGEEGSVEYWPVVRTPRAAAHRVRSLQWARQWTPVVVQILEALVDCHMVQRVDAIPVQPRPRGGPASRSRSRDSPSASSDGPSMGGRPHRVSRARRRVGAGDSGGRATMDTPVPVADNAPGVVRSSLPASTPGPTEENAVGVDDALPTSSLSTSSVGGAAVGGGSSAEVDPTVGVAVDVDGASLVQRLQPGEARELQRLGVRRDTITALGLFLGELASICDGTHPGSDVVPEDVQWALRVVERALFLSAGTQDFIASILAARLQRGRDACVLPDGDGRGGVVQMAHTFMVGAARTYLDDLQNLLADSWVNPESLPEELRREPPGGAAMGGYGDDDDEDDIRPVVVQPLEEGDNVDIPGGAPPGDMGQTLRPVVTSAEDVHAESPGAVLSSAVDPPVAVPSVPVDGATLPAGVADMGATSSWQTPPGRARSRSPRRTEAALEEDVNSHMQLLEDETAELVEVDVPRDLRQSMDVFLAEVAEYVDCPWTLQLSVALVDAMLVQLGVIRCLLARRAGRPSPLPGQDARDQSAAGCAAFCRVLSAAQWESAMAMLRSAQCDPDALPARLHGVPGAGMSATPGSPVLVEGESAASSNAVLPDYLGGGAVDDANMLDAASVP